MDKIKITRVIARMNVGGPAVEIAELMRGLDESEFEQELLTGWCAEDEADFLETQAPDIKVKRIAKLGRSLRPWDDLIVLYTLTREIRRFRPEIVHTHTAKAGVLGRIAAKLSFTRPKVIHTYHGHLLQGYFGPFKTNIVIGLERLLGKVTDRFITVGAQVRDDLVKVKIGRYQKYVVIYSGVRLRSSLSKAESRKLLDLPSVSKVVLLLGRITGIKRPDRFADMVSILAAKHPDALFIVAGAGDKESELRTTVEDRNLPVRMLGWRSDIENLLAASDIVVLTSDNEGTPLSLVQAGLAGLPTVATDVGSVRETILDQETGILTRPDAGDLADAVSLLLDNPDRAAAMGIKATEFTHSRFDPENFIEQHSALYKITVHNEP